MPRDTTSADHHAEHPSDLLLAQLYRGELSRSDRWRMRLDTTSNWALTTTAGVISYAFSNASTSHVVLLVGIWLVVTFLALEARRYRYYDLWNRRLRLLEHGFWGPVLRHEPEDPDAMRELAAELERPVLRLSHWSALATRMNRTYWPILLVLLVAWIMKVTAHPQVVGSLAELSQRAHVAFVPGWVILAGLIAFAFVSAALFASSFVGRAPLGELRPAPRSRRRALWEAFARPYELAPPRMPRRRQAGSPGPGAGPGERPPAEGARSAPP
ncbi:MAG TPA: DUF2270 domain-containing protein [Myxococcaceae bacterium]|nr:DUF2270 domain-containing protein [Myxococcaceae bacterium]